MSSMVTRLFNRKKEKKVETLDLSESNVGFDMKVGKYNHLFELMKFCEYSR